MTAEITGLSWMDTHPAKPSWHKDRKGILVFSNFLKQVTPAVKTEIALISNRLDLILLQLCDKASQGHSPEYTVEKTVPTG